MNKLSAINALQEYAVQNHMMMPTYDFENITKPSEPSKFVCQCKFNNITVSVTDTSKKAAKHKAAQLMLDNLSSKPSEFRNEQHYDPLPKSEYPTCLSPTETETSSTVSGDNSISILNEYCSKNKYNYPTYNVIGIREGKFVIQCLHQSVITEGTGISKKQAKQVAASKMLDLIYPTSNGSGLKQFTKSTENINDTVKDARVISFLQDETTKGVTNTIGLDKNEIEETLSENKIEYVEELKNRLKKFGVEFSINDLSNSPIVLLLSITSGKVNNDRQYVEFGNNYEEVLINLLHKTIQNI